MRSPPRASRADGRCNDWRVEHHISAERLTHSTPRRMDGFQRMLERRYAKQQQRIQASIAVQDKANSGNALFGQVLSAVRGGLSSQQGVGSALSKYVDLPCGRCGALGAVPAAPSSTLRGTTSPLRRASTARRSPIYILDSGEADARARIPFLDTGILDILSEATGGIGIVLEHRPLEDSADFIRPPQHSRYRQRREAQGDLLRRQLPGSAIGTHAAAVSGARARCDCIECRRGGSGRVPRVLLPHRTRRTPPTAARRIQAAIAGIDEIVAPNPLTGGDQPDRDADRTNKLLELFGLQGLSNLGDLANLNTYPLGAFQSLNWDPAVSSTEFGAYCHVLTTYGANGTYPAGVESERMAGKGLDVPARDGEPGSTPDECFATDFDAFANAKKLDAGRAWTFQYCSTWGYIMDRASRTALPADTGWQEQALCLVRPQARFDAVGLCNFALAVDRLAFVDGQYDPWRPATVHSEEFAAGGNRADTVTTAVQAHPDCWHHCDENGVKDESKTPESRKPHPTSSRVNSSRPGSSTIDARRPSLPRLHNPVR
ncbi:hypothetical protein L1887_56476 [Cichorium endivia]|nr:hypothetical protein L1887_56476 [Cichorium endivia]